MSLSGLLSTLRSVPAYSDLLHDLAGSSSIATAIDAAKPALLSALWHDTRRPMVILCPRPEDARKLVEQLFVYLGDDAPVHHFNESEVLPYERMTVDAAAIHQRLGALGALHRTDSERDPPIIVGSTMALMQLTLSPWLMESLTQVVSTGDHLPLGQAMARWAQMGYRIVPAVEEPGTVSRRGGIVDIFPPGALYPSRLDLWGDRVDSVALFDPSTQRSLRRSEVVRVMPAAEVLPQLANRKGIDSMFRRLDFGSGRTPGRDRLEDELATLLAGSASEDAGFLAGFFCGHTLLDHFPPDRNLLLVLDEPEEQTEAARDWEARAEHLRLVKEERGDLPLGFPSALSPWQDLADRLNRWHCRLELSRYHRSPGALARALPFSPTAAYRGRLDELGDRLRATTSQTVVVATQHSQRVAELLREGDVGVREARGLDYAPTPGEVAVVHVPLAEGWSLRQGEDSSVPFLTVLSDAEVFGAQKRRAPKRRRFSRHRLDVEALELGQLMVHVDHGIGRFQGTTTMEHREYILLEYAHGDRLYVPMDHLNRVAPYVGGPADEPSLTRLSTQEWSRTVSRVKESTRRLATDLLALYAARELSPGHAFAPDTPWQLEVEDAFPFSETPDQRAAVQDIKVDMETQRPMDRLVCGDVGYGKTEVAVRAAFKAVSDGKQVAVLVPTTVLAQQHFATFTERFSGFPIRVEVLSRFRSTADQAEVARALKRGQVDVVIGTHRLLQKDVGFKDLGLVIIDEEHRFGVNHKEQLKEMRSAVDVLTMTATPIPRTLHMAMAGIRDISTMDTPPEHRLPIRTYLGEASEDLVREAILREVDRGGQVFYLHNRVKSIDLVAARLHRLVPEARILIGHGQMPEEELAQVMADFADGEADVLVCTTIIESGLDLPAVNTLIVERADRFGLAQLYQLRGRIGRRSNRGYAYLLVQPGQRVTGTAQRRLQTVLAAAELGAGFRIALRDLEIRGAGNLLGAEQSGHIHAVGFELYARLLSDAVGELRGRAEGTESTPTSLPPEPQVDLQLPASLPESLVEHLPTRMSFYQRMARLSLEQEVDELGQELRDRFGRLPREVHHLLFALRVRCLARDARVASVTRQQNWIKLKLIEPIGGARVPLERALGKGVRVGNQQVQFQAVDDSWGETLLNILRRLETFQRHLPELVSSDSP